MHPRMTGMHNNGSQRRHTYKRQLSHNPHSGRKVIIYTSVAKRLYNNKQVKRNLNSLLSSVYNNYN